MNIPGKGKNNWDVILLLILMFAVVSLLLAPKSMQPRTTYTAYGLAFVFIVIMSLKILFYLMRKKSALTPLIPSETDQTEVPTEGVYPLDRHSTIGSQFSVSIADDSVPPKYENPPSYSQCVSTVTLNRLI